MRTNVSETKLGNFTSESSIPRCFFGWNTSEKRTHEYDLQKSKLAFLVPCLKSFFNIIKPLFKSLRLSNDSRKKTTTGEILNLMQVDTQTLVDFALYGHTLWSGPLTLLLIFILLWFYIRWAVFAGMGVLLVIIPYNYFISSKLNKSQNNLILAKDSRIKMINEILNGIKV